MLPSSISPTERAPKNAVIIGAGPAGLATAAFLAEAGWKCDVFEASSRERVACTSTEYLERAYGLSCQRRALQVLENLHAIDDVIASGGYWREATFRHDPKRGTIRIFGDDSEETLSCLRTEIVAGILKAIDRQWDDRIKVHWLTPVEKIETVQETHQDKVSVHLGIRSGKEEKVVSCPADVVICADGSASAVGRRYLADNEKDFNVQLSPSGFRARTLLLRHDEEWIPEENSLHFFTPVSGGRSSPMLIGRHTGPRASSAVGSDAIQTMMLFSNEHELNDSDLKATALKQVLEKTFTEAQLPLKDIVSDDELERCASSPGVTLPGTVSCSRYHSGRVVIIGDAAHQAPANAAQGLNCALEDAWVLSRLLLAEDVNITATLAQFTDQRRADVDALQRMMNHPSFAGVRPTWRSFVVAGLYQTTKWPVLESLAKQIGGQLTYRQCERNMLWQYHLPVVLATFGAIFAGWCLWTMLEHLQSLIIWWKGRPVVIPAQNEFLQ